MAPKYFIKIPKEQKIKAPINPEVDQVSDDPIDPINSLYLATPERLDILIPRFSESASASLATTLKLIRNIFLIVSTPLVTLFVWRVCAPIVSKNKIF